MKNYVDHYAKGWHEHQNDEHFQAKYQITAGLIVGHSSPLQHILGLKIIELGMGNKPIWLYLSQREKISCYMGIDLNNDCIDHCEIHISDNFAHYRKCDYMEYKPTGILKFNVFLWIGADHQPDEYSEVVNHYLPFIEKDGILIFEYWKTQDHNIFNRLKGVEGITHVDGLEFIMPYVPKEKMKKWPTVNHRILEVFRKD